MTTKEKTMTFAECATMTKQEIYNAIMARHKKKLESARFARVFNNDDCAACGNPQCKPGPWCPAS